MSKKFEKPVLTTVEYTVAARLDGSNGTGEIVTPDGLHDSGSHTACIYKVNSKSAGWTGPIPCKATSQPNSAGGSGIGTCNNN